MGEKNEEGDEPASYIDQDGSSGRAVGTNCTKETPRTMLLFKKLG